MPAPPLTRWVYTTLRRCYWAGVNPGNPKLIRTSAMAVIVCYYYARCIRLFLAPTPAILVGAACTAAACATLGPVKGLAAVSAAAFGSVWVLVGTHPDDGVGHRVGAKGFSGAICENTLAALEQLANWDAAGELANDHFPFIEFDVQQIKDDQLVVFHDTTLAAAFPAGGVNDVPLQALRAEGLDVSIATVKDLTASQLFSLHLAGREGLHVPTLRQFMQAAEELDVRRTLAVEVKALHSDAGRRELLDCISWYRKSCTARLDGGRYAANKYKPLGWAGIIAFPHLFAASFGEYGGKQWRRWAGEMKHCGIPALSCHFHHLDLAYLGG